MSTFEDRLAEADYWENVIKGALEADGWQVIHLAHLPAENGHGPRAHGDGDPTLPDLQATKHGKSIAVEVKTKDHATEGRLSKKLEHGYDRRHHDAYLRYDSHTMPTYIVIVELAPVLVFLGARIKTLTVRASELRGQPMAFFPREQLVEGWPRVLRMLNQHVYQSGWQEGRRLRQQEQEPLF